MHADGRDFSSGGRPRVVHGRRDGGPLRRNSIMDGSRDAPERHVRPNGHRSAGRKSEDSMHDSTFCTCPDLMGLQKWVLAMIHPAPVLLFLLRSREIEA